MAKGASRNWGRGTDKLFYNQRNYLPLFKVVNVFGCCGKPNAKHVTGYAVHLSAVESNICPVCKNNANTLRGLPCYAVPLSSVQNNASPQNGNGSAVERKFVNGACGKVANANILVANEKNLATNTSTLSANKSVIFANTNIFAAIETSFLTNANIFLAKTLTPGTNTYILPANAKYLVVRFHILNVGV